MMLLLCRDRVESILVWCSGGDLSVCGLLVFTVSNDPATLLYAGVGGVTESVTLRYAGEGGVTESVTLA